MVDIGQHWIPTADNGATPRPRKIHVLDVLLKRSMLYLGSTCRTIYSWLLVDDVMDRFVRIETKNRPTMQEKWTLLHLDKPHLH
jgi:hypothetical protein